MTLNMTPVEHVYKQPFVLSVYPQRISFLTALEYEIFLDCNALLSGPNLANVCQPQVAQLNISPCRCSIPFSPEAYFILNRRHTLAQTTRVKLIWKKKQQGKIRRHFLHSLTPLARLYMAAVNPPGLKGHK